MRRPDVASRRPAGQAGDRARHPREGAGIAARSVAEPRLGEAQSAHAIVEAEGSPGQPDRSRRSARTAAPQGGPEETGRRPRGAARPVTRARNRCAAPPVDPAEVQAAVAAVARSRVTQGLPPTVRDARVLNMLALLLGRPRRFGHLAVSGSTAATRSA